jgi:DNA repair protein RecN (Recombination protein N)
MLLQLSISNYILIENQTIRFDKGFSVLTGETGAGKSIVLGALALLLGERADSDVVKEEDRKCIVEGHFDISHLGLESFFNSNDLDFENTCILRREITKAGKSRAFVNDTPVNLNVLKSLGENLMDIHSQNQNHQLNNASFRLSIVDAYSSHPELLGEYRELFKNYKKSIQTVQQLKASLQTRLNEREYLQFLFNELEQVQIKHGEQDDLESEQEILTHSEEIKNALFLTSNKLYNSDLSIVEQLEEVQVKLKRIAGLNEKFAGLAERLSSGIIDLKDIGEEANALHEEFQFEPERIFEINQRLDTIYNLVRKHRVNHANELLALKEGLGEKLDSGSHLEEEVIKLEKIIALKLAKLQTLANDLSKSRKSSALHIQKLIVEQLIQLGMPRAAFKVDIQLQPDLMADGVDLVQFLFSANQGNKLTDMTKVASGGELSRIMLSLKYILALKKSIPSIVFDEIDSGVSGEIADRLAKLLGALGKQIQVISISHLPQMAARAQHHYLVYKENDSIFTRSKIKKLEEKERLYEIAAMLSGSIIGDSALEHAKELLNNKS